MAGVAGVLDGLTTIRRRRAALARHFQPDANLATLEESCIPSYCHRNVLAAGVAWWRIVQAAALCRRHVPNEPLLDFGAGSGEIVHLLDGLCDYHFVEADEARARALVHWHPHAHRTHLECLPRRHFRTILALDSLEHNRDLTGIVASLAESLHDDGIVIVSGPTESPWYRLGRRIAGFHGQYHRHTVYDLERALAARFFLRRVIGLPPVLSLFRISVWSGRPDR